MTCIYIWNDIICLKYLLALSSFTCTINNSEFQADINFNAPDHRYQARTMINSQYTLVLCRPSSQSLNNHPFHHHPCIPGYQTHHFIPIFSFISLKTVNEIAYLVVPFPRGFRLVHDSAWAYTTIIQWPCSKDGDGGLRCGFWKEVRRSLFLVYEKTQDYNLYTQQY
jgi:hypothetical protein